MNHEADWVLLLFVAIIISLLLLLLHLTAFGDFIQGRIPDRPQRRLFLSSISFFLTFLVVRLLVLSITHHFGPFHWVYVRGKHIHHLVWGILLLLVVGWGYSAEIGNGERPLSIFLGRLFAILYGVGAALTLDEFALWLNLKDVYWAKQGRESIDAVVLFGAFLAIATWGAPLWRDLRRRNR